jgi:tetratricopeptide (TPR) repeat protein
MVTTAWFQIGRVHQKAGDYEAAEAAYRRSLEIATQINNRAHKAGSLGQLGNLYDDCLNRPEEAVTFYRQATYIYVEMGDLRHEGTARNNAAAALRRLNRYDEARAEILRAIECCRQFGHAASPWASFAILHRIEEADGNHAAAHAAWVQARDTYLAYRRQGGYSQTPGGRLCDKFADDAGGGDLSKATQFLGQVSQAPDTPSWLRIAAPKYLAIFQGSRDKALADDPALDYDDAAEVLFLMERLGR